MDSKTAAFWNYKKIVSKLEDYEPEAELLQLASWSDGSMPRVPANTGQ